MKRLLLLFLLALPYGLSAQLFVSTDWSFAVEEGQSASPTVVLTADVPSGWHFYSTKSSPDGSLPAVFAFDASADDALEGALNEPRPKSEHDALCNCDIQTHEGRVVFRQNIVRKNNGAFTVKGRITYQMCNDNSCLPPEDVEIEVRVPAAKEAVALVADAQPNVSECVDTMAEGAMAQPSDVEVEEVDVVEKESSTTEKQGLGWVFLIALGAGIVTMFTPCVYPMIPMTVNYFMHQEGSLRKNRRQVWFFGGSIVALFAVIGALLTLIFGETVLYDISTAWLPNVIFFVIFFVFALSFFGLFEIKMPEKWVNKSDQQADRGGFWAPFFIALTTVLVSFSCTGPILGAAFLGLSHASTERWLSVITLLGFGVGFALPFTLLALFPRWLKGMKSGSWLNTVKIVFAFLELAFGMKFLQIADQSQGWHLLDREVYLAIWIVIFGLLGLYLLGKIRFKGETPLQHLGIGRLMLAIAVLSFVVYMIPGLWGAPLKGISGLLPAPETQDFDVERIVAQYSSPVSQRDENLQSPDRKYADSLHVPVGFAAFFDLEEAKTYARQVDKPVLIDFTGRTCSNCREMENYVWRDNEVKQLINSSFVLCALFTDVNTIELPETEWVTDNNGRVLKTLGKRNHFMQQQLYNMNAQPYYVIIDADGNVLTEKNYSYNRNIAKFVRWLNEGLSKKRMMNDTK